MKLHRILLPISVIYALINIACSQVKFDKKQVYQYISNNNIDGNKIGGLTTSHVPEYKFVVPKIDFTVRTANELKVAASKAKSGQVIFIPNHISINLSDISPIILNSGVTLMSDRGKNKSKGAILIASSAGIRPMIKVDRTKCQNIRSSDKWRRL